MAGFPGIDTGGGGFSGSSGSEASGQIGNIVGPVINVGSGSASGVPQSQIPNILFYGAGLLIALVALKKIK